MTHKAIREYCLNAKEFPQKVLDWIQHENLWNIWVPKAYGGLELNLTEGLKKLKDLAQIDGSLGWTVTLCSGANFFIGNLKEDAAKEIFLKDLVCLGGSGGVFGTAEKQGSNYILNGKWRYATGSKYLTDFTMNAQIIDNGKPLTNEDGTPYIRSFILPKNKVKIIEDWNTMGLAASVTNSFMVDQVKCDEKHSFLYTEAFHPQAIYQLNFSTFADLTLWVNYLGMAEHFIEEIEPHFSVPDLIYFKKLISQTNHEIFSISKDLEEKLAEGTLISDEYIREIHEKAKSNIRAISQKIIKAYPFLGIRASSTNHQLNQIFRDYFTATQHHIFVKR